MIEIVSAEVVTRLAQASLGISAEPPVFDEPYMAAAIRRLAGFLCPGSPRTLVRAMIDSHRGLVDDLDTFGERVEAVVETLVAVGDLLELGDVALEGEKVKSTWLVAAPPAFVLRESGTAFLLGLSADEQTPLPTEMRSRVRVDRAIRSITPEDGEDLGGGLRELGLRELSGVAWLRTPRRVDAAGLLAGYRAKLAGCPRSGEVPDLLVLDGGRNTRSYRHRWTPAGSLTGYFVVRRPQTFGADLWGYAELSNGVAHRLLDLPLQGERGRGCDSAWRIQMAIDALAGRPQEYLLEIADDGCRFDFFSPIPSWARRRLAVIGREVEPRGCLLSFLVSHAELAAEEAHLNELLYLSPVVG